MIDARIALTILCHIVVWAGCCLAIARFFFPRQKDGTTGPILALWAAGFIVLAAGCQPLVTKWGYEAAALYSAAICLIVIASHFYLGLWWRNRAMAAEIAQLHATLIERNSGPSINEICTKVARTYNLTRREEDVLALLIEGKTQNEAADHLVVSPHTVKSHARNIYRKMGINSKQGLADRLKEAALQR